MSVQITSKSFPGSQVRGPATHVWEVTPNDEGFFDYYANSLYIAVQGDVRIMTAAGDIITYPAYVGRLPVAVCKVFATGTTATGILGEA